MSTATFLLTSEPSWPVLEWHFTFIITIFSKSHEIKRYNPRANTSFWMLKQLALKVSVYLLVWPQHNEMFSLLRAGIHCWTPQHTEHLPSEPHFYEHRNVTSSISEFLKARFRCCKNSWWMSHTAVRKRLGRQIAICTHITISWGRS